MAFHPDVEITGGDIFVHDLEIVDIDTGDPIDISTHDFSFKFREAQEGVEITLTGTCAASGTNTVRLTVPADQTTILAASHDGCVYAIRDDTLGLTLVEVPAKVKQGVAS